MSQSDIWPEFPDTLPAGLEFAELSRSGGARLNSQPRLLLVDDDPFMLGMQSRMLRSMGYLMIGTAGNAQQALARLLKNPNSVDVIICDLKMPGLDGIEFLQVLAVAGFSGNVILLSGEDPRIMHTVQQLLGKWLVVLGCIEKPAERAVLDAMIRTWKPAAPPEAAKIEESFTGDEIHAANAHNQWVLHYQPKVDLRSGEWVGVEALVRWEHPLFGLVYPDRFIAVAEECGAIGSLTEWVLREALDQQMRWRGLGWRVHMSVNISAENLCDVEFVHKVVSAVANCGASPGNVTLELTESQLISTSAVALENLARLRMQRFGLSIDDFGTGHSSLAQLRNVPFTELKVDRSFVHGARTNQVIRPILEGSIGIGKGLGMLVVAEGVETKEDWHLLQKLGCDLAQGYFISKPICGERISEWLELWQAGQSSLVRP